VLEWPDLTGSASPISLELLDDAWLRDILELWDPSSLIYTGDQLDEDEAQRRGLGDNPLWKYVVRNPNPDPLRSILASVRGQYGAFCIAEAPYVDQAFLRSHADYHIGSFSRRAATCVRLHFWRHPEPATVGQQLVELLLRGCSRSEEDLRAELGDLGYLGYSVLRSLRSYVVGRTAIRFNTQFIGRGGTCPHTSAEDDTFPILTVRSQREANVLSCRLTVQPTCEFVQTEPALGQCATSALCVTTEHMGRRFGTRRPSYAALTRIASGIAQVTDDAFGRSLVRDGDGLSAREIQDALLWSGLQARIIRVSRSGRAERERVSHELYSAIESGLPATLALFEPTGETVGHAVVAVGHSLPTKVQKENVPTASLMYPRVSQRHVLVSSFVNLYYCHDDRYGPYNRCELGQDAELKDRFHFIAAYVGRTRTPQELSEVIIAQPPMVRNGPDDMLDTVLEYWDRHVGPELPQGLGGRFAVWRSFLVSGSHFKHSVVSRAFNPELRAWYALRHLPRYVWVFEFSLVTEYQAAFSFDGAGESSPPSRPIHGEVLCDATCSPHEPTVVTMRMLGKCWDGGLRFEDYGDVGEIECCQLPLDDRF